MGQQQLLLLVLGIVIVGLAVVAGINAFGENQTKSQKDALLNEGMRVATDVQSHALKPTQMGGGDGDLPANLAAIGLSDPYQTPWGEVTYSQEEGTLTLDTAISENDGDAVITLTADSNPPRLSQDWSGEAIAAE